VTWSCKGVSVAHLAPTTIDVLHQVEYGDPVTNRREQTCAVGREQQVSSAVDGPEQIGKLARVSRVTSGSAAAALTWKSVFIAKTLYAASVGGAFASRTFLTC
jgi:hypothetical protein